MISRINNDANYVDTAAERTLAEHRQRNRQYTPNIQISQYMLDTRSLHGKHTYSHSSLLLLLRSHVLRTKWIKYNNMHAPSNLLRCVLLFYGCPDAFLYFVLEILSLNSILSFECQVTTDTDE